MQEMREVGVPKAGVILNAVPPETVIAVLVQDALAPVVAAPEFGEPLP